MKNAIVALLAIILMSACEKGLFDYRNDMVGDYDLEYSYTYWYGGSISRDTTVFYQGTVEYGSKGQITIDYPNGDVIPVYVDKKGAISIDCHGNIGEVKDGVLNFSIDDDGCNGPRGSDWLKKVSGIRR